MKKLLMLGVMMVLVTVPAFALAGCSGYLPQALIGRWELVRFQDHVNGTDLQTGDWGFTTWEGELRLNPDGTFIDQFGVTTIQGTWWTSGNNITFRYNFGGFRIDDVWQFTVSGDTFSKTQNISTPLGQSHTTFSYERVVAEQ